MGALAHIVLLLLAAVQPAGPWGTYIDHPVFWGPLGPDGTCQYNASNPTERARVLNLRCYDPAVGYVHLRRDLPAMSEYHEVLLGAHGCIPVCVVLKWDCKYNKESAFMRCDKF